MAERRSTLEALEINDPAFYQGRRVFVTGHTGFKGAWLCAILAMAGAEVTGFALPPAEESLWTLAGLERHVRSVYGDIRELDSLRTAFREARPEIVFHLAAQPIVREGYRDPVGTYHTNVMGTVHILECVRETDYVRSFLNVTTDKVYQNFQWSRNRCSERRRPLFQLKILLRAGNRQLSRQLFGCPGRISQYGPGWECDRRR